MVLERPNPSLSYYPKYPKNITKLFTSRHNINESNEKAYAHQTSSINTIDMDRATVVQKFGP